MKYKKIFKMNLNNFNKNNQKYLKIRGINLWNNQEQNWKYIYKMKIKFN